MVHVLLEDTKSRRNAIGARVRAENKAENQISRKKEEQEKEEKDFFPRKEKEEIIKNSPFWTEL